ncbi:peptide-methionine (S)-S-oxide reductase MsrA [bacterium]|nr:peptide-methionine (S)-S-oxide reductase MsrA [bacterium]MCB9479324.1 peptide-methionine (S)-S-oxide reductase MsrA [Deltaproteobacteria bacterium]
MPTAVATFAAGCFWGVEDVFRQVPGVLDAAVGYMGGEKDHPTYEEVCADETGHAEVVQLTYDPDVLDYNVLLSVFWQVHDPTQVDRQGPDVGRQYRSVIFFHLEEQRVAAKMQIAMLNESGKLRRPIATSVEPAMRFWRAEEYHQRYFEKNGIRHCRIEVVEETAEDTRADN